MSRKEMIPPPPTHTLKPKKKGKKGKKGEQGKTWLPYVDQENVLEHNVRDLKPQICHNIGYQVPITTRLGWTLRRT